MSLAKGLSIYVNGYNLAVAFQSFNPTATLAEHDATALADTARSYEPGFQDASISGAGVWEYDSTNLDKIHNILSAAILAQTSLVVTWSLETLAVGAVAMLINGAQSKYEINSPLDALITVVSDIKSTNGLNFGKWLFNAAVASTTTNGTSIDNAAASTNGGLFHVHVQDGTATDCDVKVQHSTDNSVWVDLASCNNFAATGASSATVAAGTTVNRYIRASVTTSGGSSTVQAAFARR
jgi:hypothetical protein